MGTTESLVAASQQLPPPGLFAAALRIRGSQLYLQARRGKRGPPGSFYKTLLYTCLCGRPTVYLCFKPSMCPPLCKVTMWPSLLCTHYVPSIVRSWARSREAPGKSSRGWGGELRAVSRSAWPERWSRVRCRLQPSHPTPLRATDLEIHGGPGQPRGPPSLALGDSGCVNSAQQTWESSPSQTSYHRTQRLGWNVTPNFMC
jgi:hypothetical protein